MEENKDQGTELQYNEAEITPKRNFGKWVENVWYHYKWHILISLFIIVTLVICITQCVKNSANDPDIHIVYVGDRQIAKPNDRAGGDTPFSDLEAALSDLASDYNGDGEKIVDLETLYWVDPSERGELIGAESDKSMTDAAYYVSLFNETMNTLDMLKQKSDYFVWFISPEIYTYMKGQADGAVVFMPLAAYLTDNASAQLVESGDAIKLSSLFISGLDGIDGLPADTLVVLRAPTVLEGGDNEAYRNSETFLKGVIALG